jgi:TusA-related sulfurtransferase
MSQAVIGGDAFYDAGDQGCSGPAFKEIVAILTELDRGRTLEIRSTGRAGRDGLRAFCRMRGWPIEAEDAGPVGDRILVRKP